MRNRKKYFKINIYLDNTILQLFILHGFFFFFCSKFWFLTATILTFTQNEKKFH